MSTGILLNLDRVAAARLSFFLGLPALTGAGLYELKDATGGDVGTGALAVGTLVSFVVAYASIAWLLRFVTRHTFDSFVIYRVLLALALIGLLIGGALDA
jgi:undecaprenyl-diphosphatase